MLRAWRWLRTLAGDDAYERYCAHQRTCHPAAPVPDRRAFYLEQQRQKWSGVNRCC
jgi:uncharacterized short protein YbdD (DUF466 family)